MTAHPVLWQAPQPLWARFGDTAAEAATAADQGRPSLLRFATDDFMEQLLGLLATDPSRLDGLVARPETWRTPADGIADFAERTPLPSVARTSIRRALARTGKPAVPPTTSLATIVEQSQTVQRPLKLYQPAHQRYYLVGASLVCAVPGLPERAVTAGGGDGQINFVLRRRLPPTPGNTSPTDLREFAYVRNGQTTQWQRVGDADVDGFVPGEELFPTFALAFHDDAAHPRTLWTGLVPVGRREEFMSAAVNRTSVSSFAAGQQGAVQAPVVSSAALSVRARLTQFQMDVATPWRNLIQTSKAKERALTEPPAFDDKGELAKTKPQQVFDFNLLQQHASWLLLLDFADFLDAHLHDVSAAIDNDGATASSLGGDRKRLYDWLGTTSMSTALANAMRAPRLTARFAGDSYTFMTPPMYGGNAVRTVAGSMREALRKIRAPGVREKLEKLEVNYTSKPGPLNNTDWPPFHFVLAGVDTSYNASGPYTALSQLAAPGTRSVPPDPFTASAQAADGADIDQLCALVGRALDRTTEKSAPPLPFALQVRNAMKDSVGDAGWFVIRFVYTRRDCGPLHPPSVSAPTQQFQLANFFDPDAPARPVRITLPLDTSPAALRKTNKNTAFVISDMLCGQIQRVRGLGLIDLVRAVLPWPLHKDLDLGDGASCSLGWICSLSIPIVTICALILLIIIVTLLDLVFHWLPFFVFCFPLPGLKGKRATA